jgi:hypothetical protein
MQNRLVDCPFKRGIYWGCDLPEARGAKGVLPHHDLGFTRAVQVTKVVFILYSKCCLGVGIIWFSGKNINHFYEITLSYLRWVMTQGARGRTSSIAFHLPKQCCGSVTYWYGSGPANPCLWLTDPDPALDPAIFVIDLQDANKNYRYFLPFEGTLTSFFKYKKSSRSHKTVGIKIFFFLTIFAWW